MVPVVQHHAPDPAPESVRRTRERATGLAEAENICVDEPFKPLLGSNPETTRSLNLGEVLNCFQEIGIGRNKIERLVSGERQMQRIRVHQLHIADVESHQAVFSIIRTVAAQIVLSPSLRIRTSGAGR